MVPVTHVVLFRYYDTVPWTTLSAHFRDFANLKHKCVKEDGKPYILSLRMGKNTSWENFARGMTHCFILEFINEADRDYYLIRDKVHHAFSDSARGLIQDSIVLDCQDNVMFDEIRTPSTSTLTSTSSSISDTSFNADNKILNGSCHCGKVKWEVRLEEYKHVICHCRTCQLLGGGPYSCNAIVEKDALQVKEGKLSTYSYTGDSGNLVLCYHCGNCTSHVYHHQMSNPTKIVVRTLLLQGGDKFGVAGEIFAEGKLGWVSALRDALYS